MNWLSGNIYPSVSEIVMFSLAVYANFRKFDELNQGYQDQFIITIRLSAFTRRFFLVSSLNSSDQLSSLLNIK